MPNETHEGHINFAVTVLLSPHLVAFNGTEREKNQ